MKIGHYNDKEYLSLGIFSIVDYLDISGKKGAVSVLVDGVNLKGAFYADAINGFAEHYLTDANGKHILEGNKAARKRVYGKVEFLLNGELVCINEKKL